MRISVDGRGRAYDNVFVVPRKLSGLGQKYEEVYLHDHRDPHEAWQGLDRYFGFYNRERLHQSLELAAACCAIF